VVEGLAAGARAAGDVDGRFLAVFDIEILRSVQGGVAPHHLSPTSAMEPAGQDPRARQSPKLTTVPLCMGRNASPFRIILLLISGVIEHPDPTLRVGVTAGSNPTLSASMSINSIG
jgi:hypothetical protein